MDILLKAGEDDDLGLGHLGILVRFHVHGPITTEETRKWYVAADIDLLVERGYLIRGEFVVKIKGMVDDEDEITKAWKEFTKLYPGVNNMTLQNFKKKWKAGNKWRKFLPELLPNLTRQIAERSAITGYNQRMEHSGQKNKMIFLPEWKNLSTYINQMAWLEVRPIPAAVQEMAPARVQEEEVPGTDDIYTKFKAWVLEQGKAHSMNEDYVAAITPLRSEYEGMREGTLPPFTNWRTYATPTAFKQSLINWTETFLSDARLRSTHSQLLDYYKVKYREVYRSDN